MTHHVACAPAHALLCVTKQTLRPHTPTTALTAARLLSGVTVSQNSITVDGDRAKVDTSLPALFSRHHPHRHIAHRHIAHWYHDRQQQPHRHLPAPSPPPAPPPSAPRSPAPPPLAPPSPFRRCPAAVDTTISASAVTTTAVAATAVAATAVISTTWALRGRYVGAEECTENATESATECYRPLYRPQHDRCTCIALCIAPCTVYVYTASTSMYMCMYMGMYMGMYKGMYYYVHIHVCTCVSWTSRMRVSSFLSRLHVHGAMPVQGVFVYTGHVQGGVVFKCGQWCACCVVQRWCRGARGAEVRTLSGMPSGPG